MDRVKVGDLEFSRIVYGMWRLGDDADTSPAHVEAKIEACLEQGITTMDQADIYGAYGAETILGAAFRASPGLRDKVELVTKCDIVAPIGKHADKRVKYYDTSGPYITSCVENSLTQMATDRIDLLLIHRPDPMMDHAETGAALDALVASGKVREVGVSNFRPWDWQLLQSAMEVPLVTNQIELSVMHLDPFTNGDLAFHQAHGHPVMAWSPLAGGRLFAEEGAAVREVLTRIAHEQGVDPGAVAVAFLLRHPAKILPVMGTNALDRIRGLSAALSVELTRQDWFEIYTATLGHEVA
ncbi:aldo/keto reductase [Roseibacterium sp. SDUM158016]|uniref:aldo/keto reductase n=1 Tax=Roseicyclus sediminis TaxID=2980997 RepID=UPI0021CE0519|nr:aldo/keto reductase [Roseibacterium sp. SDUM158016]MCU4653586.1 aldo/keto reductase [Roseibacterium sp. SDUM158016]